MTLTYALQELIYLIHYYFHYCLSYRKTFALSFSLLIFSVSIYFIDGAHQSQIRSMEHFLLWIIYWFGLGVASSIGLGTGLHTFLLYLGPFIARVTLAAYECGSIQFPRPPYPKQIVCPSLIVTNQTDETDVFQLNSISFWNILWKVKFEAFFWGLGTAFGELPPYFMARAARRTANHHQHDEELVQFEHLINNAESHSARDLTFSENIRYSIYRLIKRIGFFGILLCASIPNPLFDLAGITCGYFLIPFWEFFLATIIGKALIKMSLQTVFIIILFSEHHVEQVIDWIKSVPYLGQFFQRPLKDWFKEQKNRMHGQMPINTAERSIVSKFFDYFVMIMIGYFLVSIINSLAQKYYQRRKDEQKEHED